MRRDVLDLIVAKYVKQVVDLQLEIPVAEPASETDLRQVQSDAEEKLGANLDPAYLYLAGVADGIGANGFTIYATKRRRVQLSGMGEIRYRESIIQENLDCRQYGVGSSDSGSDPRSWLVYGAGGSGFIIHHLPSRRFQLRPKDNTSHAVCNVSTFEELVWEVFRYSLELGDYPTREN